MIKNLEQILTKEVTVIKDLTDFEQGLRFAIHRLLDLKQMQLNYLMNPWYAKNEEYDFGSVDNDIRELL